MKKPYHEWECPCHKTDGGPSETEEKCKTCGKEWTRHRGGSWDWEYEDCFTCQMNKVVEEGHLKK